MSLLRGWSLNAGLGSRILSPMMKPNFKFPFNMKGGTPLSLPSTQTSVQSCGAIGGVRKSKTPPAPPKPPVDKKAKKAAKWKKFDAKRKTRKIAFLAKLTGARKGPIPNIYPRQPLYNYAARESYYPRYSDIMKHYTKFPDDSIEKDYEHVTQDVDTVMEDKLVFDEDTAEHEVFQGNMQKFMGDDWNDWVKSLPKNKADFAFVNKAREDLKDELDTKEYDEKPDDILREYEAERKGIPLTREQVGTRVQRTVRIVQEEAQKDSAEMDSSYTRILSDPADDEEALGPVSSQLVDTWEYHEVIQIGYHTKVTKGGRIYSYSALVVVGNGRGTAGYGYGRGKTAAEATDKATRLATKNVVSLQLYKGKWICRDIHQKCRGSIMVFRSHPHNGIDRGASNVCHPKMTVFTEAFGLEGVTVRSHGRRTWKNMLEAAFTALPKVRSPELTARDLGARMISVAPYGQQKLQDRFNF